MKKKICQYLSEVVEGMKEEDLLRMMEIPPEETMGDYALPCFVLAKKMRKNPASIAAEIGEKLKEQKECLGIEKVETVGAYCNIYLKRECYAEKCFSTLRTEIEIVRCLIPTGTTSLVRITITGIDNSHEVLWHNFHFITV